MCSSLHVQYRYSRQVSIKLEYSRQIFEKYSNSMQILPVGAQLFHADGQADGPSFLAILLMRLKTG